MGSRIQRTPPPPDKAPCCLYWTAGNIRFESGTLWPILFSFGLPHCTSRCLVPYLNTVAVEISSSVYKASAFIYPVTILGAHNLHQIQD